MRNTPAFAFASWFAVLLACSLALATAADADGIPPPPTCPPGTTLRMCHGPAFCEPVTCAADSECSGGTVCREVSYCVASFYCGGGRPPPDSGSSGFTTGNAARSCEDGCMAGETCTPSRVCVAPGTTPDGSHATYCGCRAAGSGAGARGVALGLAPLMLGLMWRRARPRR